MVTVNQVYSSAPLVQSTVSTNKYFLLRKSNNQTMFGTKPYILGVGGMMMMMFIAVLTITNVQAKDHRCRRPVIQNCNASEYYIYGWKYTGWYYHTELKMCRPLYTPNGQHTCKENYNLPMARQMCEDLCAEPCTRSNGAPGICMPKDLCVIITRSSSASSCASDILNCCPKATDKDLYTKPIRNRNGLVEEGSLKTQKDPEYGHEPNYYYYLPYLS